ILFNSVIERFFSSLEFLLTPSSIHWLRHYVKSAVSPLPHVKIEDGSSKFIYSLINFVTFLIPSLV
ncbi:hypothetical protein KCA24_34330, partial [Escherichia coli]|nr:hypothetical protein [Escherichia coli]